MIKKIAIGLTALIILAVGAFYIYTLDYYRASDYVQDYIEDSGLKIETDGNLTYIYPDGEAAEEGIIFYPGGKVEAIAYTPLLVQLAQEGYTCVLVEMPMNLAVFNINGAEDVLESDTGISDWYLSGHSLGGAMASSYVDKNHELFEGLILMGAYPINEAPLPTIAIYGTYDIMLDLDKVTDADEVHEIVDGNHAWFGDYGEQEGDGEALITREAQQAEAVDRIVQFIEDNR